MIPTADVQKIMERRPDETQEQYETRIAAMEADTVQDAIIELADNAFKQDTTPQGPEVDEGDTWYDMDDNQFKVYRETAPTVFEWVPIMLGNISVDSDTLDAGSF